MTTQEMQNYILKGDDYLDSTFRRKAICQRLDDADRSDKLIEALRGLIHTMLTEVIAGRQPVSMEIAIAMIDDYK
jgi:hypothetical protein